MNGLALSDDDLLVLQKCLNDGTEPPAELAKKLFPSLYSTFDFKTLKDSRIPTIEYAGKRPEAAILNEASAFGGGSPLQLERYFEGGKLSRGMNQVDLFKESETDSNWRNLIVQGDNLQFLKTCYLNQDPIIKDKVKGKVKLIYIDPPFATKSDFQSKDGVKSYADKIATAEFLENLRERIIFLKQILSDDGTLYVHLDWKKVHYVKVIMDEVFDEDHFKNEITWFYENKLGTGGQTFDSRHDTLLVYTKGKNWVHNPILVPVKEQKKQPVTQKINGKRIWLRDEQGNRIYEDSSTERPIGDVWTIPIINPVASERIDYPTQKPEALLERVIRTGSNPDDLVMDVFGGSGTTGAVAEKLGRRWIVCDFGKHAIYTIQGRLSKISDSYKLNNQNKKKELYEKPPQPFCVVSVGAFDFQKIMNLRKNRDAYISFVMGIFGLTERDEKLAVKYRVNNVCTLKDGHPVEIYPVWDDEFLKNVRIDEEYLRGILAQSGGNLKGDYYIIAPESCVRVGEMPLKNARGERITFKPLTFPYKVLEDVARNFSIEEQPSSPDNINKLISSVGFYFNETVEIDLKKTAKGLKISRFKTSILDRDEKRYDGLEGLAMLLVDSDYDEEKGFAVDTVIYQKDIKDQEAAASGLTTKSAVIAIDKHGNESGIVKVI